MYKRSGRTILATMFGFAISTMGAAQVPEPSGALALTHLATYTTGAFGESAAEIVTYDPGTQRLFVVNAQAATLDVLDISDPAAPVALTALDVRAYGAVANSADSYGGVVAVAVENAEKTEPGVVVFLDPEGELLSQVKVGAIPDMLTFTPDAPALWTGWATLKPDFADAKALQRDLAALLERYGSKRGNQDYLVRLALTPISE